MEFPKRRKRLLVAFGVLPQVRQAASKAVRNIAQHGLFGKVASDLASAKHGMLAAVSNRAEQFHRLLAIRADPRTTMCEVSPVGEERVTQGRQLRGAPVGALVFQGISEITRALPQRVFRLRRE